MNLYYNNVTTLLFIIALSTLLVFILLFVLLAANYLYFKNDRHVNGKMDKMKGSYLGPEFSGIDVERMAKKYKAVYKKYDDFEKLAEKVAALIDGGNAIGWMQGRMEFGPRALGARSIIGDARNEEMQKKLNLKIKYRESFRPFAPSVLAEESSDYFNINAHSPWHN